MESPETEAPLDESLGEESLESALSAKSSAEATGQEEKPPLALEVQVNKTNACSRHITVTIPRTDVDRYFTEAFDELQPKAEVPGFRPGRAPRKLVESKFRDRMKDQVKGSLVMDSIAQITEEADFSAISEPDFDFEAIELPSEGPLIFEFNIEVRPEFEVPQWKGLKLERPVHEYTEDEISMYMGRLLRRYAKMEEKTGPIEADDFASFDLTVRDGDETVAELAVPPVAINDRLSFRDANIEDFANAVLGASKGERRTTKIKISGEVEVENVRGKELDAELLVNGVMALPLPELNQRFLDDIGGFADVDELRLAIREELDRQMEHRQQRRLREQIADQLLADADWELPQDLLRRQARRELQRIVMELQSAGYNDEAIRSHANQIQQNSLSSTARSMKEHFMLERIAELEEIDADPDDFDLEIRMIAAQSQESSRRVRARLEKRGQMDALRNQIIERKVLDLIVSTAEISDVPYERPKDDTSAVDLAVVSGAREGEPIPEAKYAGGDASEESPVKP